jgi:transposase
MQTRQDNLFKPGEDLHERLMGALLQLERERQAKAQYQSEVERLQEIIRRLKRQAFGKKSERWEDLHCAEQLGLFNEAEALAAKGAGEPEETERITYTRKKGQGGRKPLPEELPREDVVIEIPESERFCPHDGAPLHEMGEEVSEKLKVIPAQFSVVRTIRKKYGCRKCAEHVETAPAPLVLLPKTISTPELLAFLISSKYDQALPLYRIEEFFGHRGVELSRTTMARWLIRLLPDLMPVWNILEEWVIESGYVAIDATTVQVLKEDGRSAESKSSMWARGSPERKIVLFDYDQSGGGAVAEKLLLGFRGFLQSDQHQGYNRLNPNEAITRLGCMAHSRRRFFAAAKDGAKAGQTLAEEGGKLLRRLYDVEDEAKERALPPEGRFDLRQTNALPILAEFKTWSEENYKKIPPRSLIGNAVGYVIEQWDYLIRYCDDGRLEIDNNWLERLIRYFATGRKNWLFSDTVEGAQSSAMLYSLVVTAKLNGKDPYQTILDLLRGLPAAATADDYAALANLLLENPVKN